MNDIQNDQQPTTDDQQHTTLEPPKGNRLAYLALGGLLLAVIAAGVYVITRDRMPDLDHPYMPRADLPRSIQEESAAKVAQAVAELRDNPGLESRWLELAAQFKGIYDYEFAEEIYRYVIKTFPAEVTAYASLADMYRYELKRYDDSEIYWRKVIALEPDYIPAYRELHHIYRYNLKKDEAATIAPLLEGLAGNPGNTDLLIPLGYYYRDEAKDSARARQYFLEARAAAAQAGKAALVSQIDAELATLLQ